MDEKKKIITLKPKTLSYTGFLYEGFEDAKELMLFLGKQNLSINIDGTIRLKKYNLKGGEIIIRDSFGNVEKLIQSSELKGKYDIISSEKFNDSHKIIINNLKDKK